MQALIETASSEHKRLETLLAVMNKPFLKWAGGKHKLATFIEAHIPLGKRMRLVEPFAGSAAVSLALEFDEYLLNDNNADLILLYQTLKSEKSAFIDYAQSFFTEENNQETRFYALRERFNHEATRETRAALFIYLNRHAFNGLCRYNSKGMFNVPFGKYKAPYFPRKEMLAFVEKSSRIQLMSANYSEVFAHLDANDVVYCDPPYVPLSDTASFTSYTKEGFSKNDQILLASLVESTVLGKQRTLVSNHDTAFTRDIYKNARIETVEVQRNIAAKSTNRTKVKELLAIYEPTA